MEDEVKAIPATQRTALLFQKQRGTLERNEELRRRVQEGEKPALVARSLGMTKQRAHQVLRQKWTGLGN